mmetsp:Transcript_31127/g.96909  ORF Transcript_31127/g.96909 Transcript_31127/m.96909 type:complete len:274 (-) Transcript_31127:66-887(-)
MRCRGPLPPPRDTRACTSRRNCAGCSSPRRFSASPATASRSSFRPACPPAARPILTISTGESSGNRGLSSADASAKSAPLAAAGTGWPLAFEVASNSRMTSATGKDASVRAAASATHPSTGASASDFVPATASAKSASGGASVSTPRASSADTAPGRQPLTASRSARAATQEARSAVSMWAAHLVRASAQCCSASPLANRVLIASAASLAEAEALEVNTASTASFVTCGTSAELAASTTCRISGTRASTSSGVRNRTNNSLFSSMPGSPTSAA